MLQTRVSVSDSNTQVSSQTVDSTEAFSKDLSNSRQQSTVKTVKFSMRMIKCQDKVHWIVKHIFLISLLCTVGHVVREWCVYWSEIFLCLCRDLFKWYCCVSEEVKQCYTITQLFYYTQPKVGEALPAMIWDNIQSHQSYWNTQNWADSGCWLMMSSVWCC